MPLPKKNPKWFLLFIGGGLIVLALAVWLARQTPATNGMMPMSTNVAGVSNSSVVTQIPIAVATNTVASKISETLAALETTTDAQTVRELLAKLRTALAAMPKDKAVVAIRQFLDSKADAATHLGFKVGQNGLLDDAPTLRTFLLDELARLDSAAAADYSKVILASKDSPDEWAIALRNLANGDASADGRDLLEQKTSELLQYQPWQQNPSVGYLEAFDTAVYLRSISLMPALTDMVRLTNNPAVAHASFLALDRLVIDDPGKMLAMLEAHPDMMQGRELTRADYFARADVHDPQQRQILENYLLNPQISPAEIDAFASIFPNDDFMISPNLLTQNQTVNRDTLARRDAESLRVVQQWLADPRFAKAYPSLEKAEQRLIGFVQQENQKP